MRLCSNNWFVLAADIRCILGILVFAFESFVGHLDAHCVRTSATAFTEKSTRRQHDFAYRTIACLQSEIYRFYSVAGEYCTMQNLYTWFACFTWRQLCTRFFGRCTRSNIINRRPITHRHSIIKIITVSSNNIFDDDSTLCLVWHWQMKRPRLETICWSFHLR